MLKSLTSIKYCAGLLENPTIKSIGKQILYFYVVRERRKLVSRLTG